MTEKKNNSFSGHFIELRSRLIKSLLFIFVVFVISYTFAQEIYNFLIDPYANAVKNSGTNRRLIFTALHETFLTYLKVAFFALFFLAVHFFSFKYGNLLHQDYTQMKKKLYCLI